MDFIGSESEPKFAPFNRRNVNSLAAPIGAGPHAEAPFGFISNQESGAAGFEWIENFSAKICDIGNVAGR
jgi:hypothetical protein